jgi:hypothetical protein
VAIAVALAAAIGVPYLSNGAAVAYEVTNNGNGTVTVQINSLRDAAGLQEKLGENGIPAVVQYLPEGKACQQPWFTPAASGTHASGVTRTSVGAGGSPIADGGPVTFTLQADVPTGDTLVITISDSVLPDGRHASALAIGTATGQVPPCQMVDAPAGTIAGVPPPPGAVTSSSGP